MRVPLPDGAGTTAFDPAVHGLPFPNAFVNVLVRLPGGRRLATAGRCGGMAALALDHFVAGVPAPRLPADLWAPSRVPPDEHVLARAVLRRQLRSFAHPSALRFLAWSLLPDGDLGPLAGVERRTVADEVPRLVALLDAGRPAVLGLVVARALPRAGDNHQVVAFGWERRGPTTTVLVHDPNSPGRTVRLVHDDAATGWAATNGARWRGLFVHPHHATPPPVLTREPADPRRVVRGGDTVVLCEVRTGRRLAPARVAVDGRELEAADGSRRAVRRDPGAGGTWRAGERVALGPVAGRGRAEDRWTVVEARRGPGQER
ncbi:hypothetical protein [Cellulomonas endophytica]|uniref:hypothetical protein n=1 Tax=Cellulomonas endophytica TaxID=2494735 RepID=UPI0010112932|nr:hypothetical protein [Cellulomonas endophytica]